MFRWHLRLFFSVEMRIYLTPEKADKLIKLCSEIINKPKPTILDIASLVGAMTVGFPAVMYGPLHYRNIDTHENAALKQSKGNFNSHISLSSPSIEELNWLVVSVPVVCDVVCHGEHDIEIQTDSSTTGWVGVREVMSTRGHWTPAESLYHINYLEILAVLMTLKAYCKNGKDKRVHMLVDNTSAVAATNHMGTSHSTQCN